MFAPERILTHKPRSRALAQYSYIMRETERAALATAALAPPPAPAVMLDAAMHFDPPLPTGFYMCERVPGVQPAAMETALPLREPPTTVFACRDNQMMVDRMGGSVGKRQPCAADLELSAKRHRG